MAPTYKLTYFDKPGKAEPIRMLFKYGGIQFEDIRIKREDWPAIKPSTPFGQIPILEINGTTYNQSTAIIRYVAKQVKLTGANDLEELEINSIVDTLADLRQKVAQYSQVKDEKVKEEKKTVLLNETIPFYFDRFDVIAKNNNGHLAIGRLTWADICFTSFYDGLLTMYPEIAKKYPNLTAVLNNVASVPCMKSWITERPIN